MRVSAPNKVDFPALGSPTSPQVNPIVLVCVKRFMKVVKRVKKKQVQYNQQASAD